MTNLEPHTEQTSQDITVRADIDRGKISSEPLYTDVIGYRFYDCSLEAATELLIHAANTGLKREVYFVNAHCVNVAAQNSSYAALLEDATLLFADGAGMALAARMWGTRLRNNVNGTDLFPLICEQAARTNTPLALLGASHGVAQACAENMRNTYPGLQIVRVNHGFLDADEDIEEIENLNMSGARILFVAKGVPLQELWIKKNANRLKIPVILGVGALFDFYSGSIHRAPMLVRKLRLEWLFRLLMQPQLMFHRYIIGNPRFVLRVLRMSITRSH
jgi:N-acetylglucosaminyldiphosphoundecaprenol N-acetyl-beta-D-mannosaminyltransferase